jgi:hypothetical protein
MGGILYVTGALADGTVTTAKLADDAVTDAKLANSINSAIAANTAKPSITINNNADNRVITGSGTANTLNGESNVVIDSSGNVGIGTTSPAGKVHINSAANTATFLAEGEIDNPQYPSYGFSGQNADNGDRGAGMYLPADSTLAFSTAGTEKVRIQNSGGISFNGDTATANALDDYEEGSWTPAFNRDTSGYSSLNTSVDLLTYRKVGSVVHISGRVLVGTSNNGANGNIRITLPFTSHSGHGNQSGYAHIMVNTHGVNFDNDTVQLFAEISPSQSTMNVHQVRDNGNWLAFNSSQLQHNNNEYFGFVGSYVAA